MPYRFRFRTVAALGVAAAVLLWVAPRVPANSDSDIRVVSGVALVNDATRKPILGLSPLTDGTLVDLTRLAHRKLSLRATVTGGVDVGSIAFTIGGETGGRSTRTDSRAPYFLCGDYTDCPVLATPGAYRLTVQAYAGPKGTGSPLGTPFSVRFEVTETPSTPRPIDVLFVGNSLLGTVSDASGEDTPDVVSHLADLAGRSVTVTKVIHFGASLRRTWDDGMVAQVLNGAQRYDFIVLQELSTLVATKPAVATNTLLNAYAPTFSRALKPGGRIVLFKNWALVHPAPFKSRAAAKRANDANYAALSAALATPNLLAPIGDAFETVIAAKGASYLIVPDGKHPKETAIYLDAAVLYGIFFRESPRNLADLYLPASAASYLRSVAATAIGY